LAGNKNGGGRYFHFSSMIGRIGPWYVYGAVFIYVVGNEVNNLLRKNDVQWS